MNERIIAKLEAMMTHPPAAGQSWQSSHSLHKLPEFEPLVVSTHAAAQRVLEFLHIGYRVLAISGCWANVNAPGASHPMHSHPNNFLSGVYYAQIQEGADTIAFHDPRSQTGILRPPVTELTAENTDQVVVGVVPGTLLLFPAWLQHPVGPNRSTAPRISVSFNLMFSAYAGHLSPPLWGRP